MEDLPIINEDEITNNEDIDSEDQEVDDDQLTII